jgi:hypothetical protein
VSSVPLCEISVPPELILIFSRDKALEWRMCTFVTKGKCFVKQVVARFIPCAAAREAQIKAAVELAAMKKYSVARGGTDNSGPFQRALRQRDVKSFGPAPFRRVLCSP